MQGRASDLRALEKSTTVMIVAAAIVATEFSGTAPL